MTNHEQYVILIVNDNKQIYSDLHQAFSYANYQVEYTTNECQALDFIDFNLPDLIVYYAKLYDVHKDLDYKLKNSKDFSSIPIILIDYDTTEAEIVAGFKHGCIDYISKPIFAQVLIARVNSHLAVKQQIKDLQASIISLQKAVVEIQQKNIDLKQMMGKLKIASTTDYLTGIYNKRYAIEIFQEHISNGNNIEPFTVIIADIDSFKSINDTYGHLCGDAILKSVVNTLKSSLREGDLFCRWGGEEFLFLLPCSNIEKAKVFAERMRKLVTSTLYKCDVEEISVTITMGIAEYSDELGIEGTIKKADDALYKGKRNGKNQVILASL